jgi:hypothetical protein
MDDSEDTGAKEPYGIQDLADALTPPPGGPTTPIRSPSSKKKRKYEMGVHSDMAGKVRVDGIPNTHKPIRAQQLSCLF